MVQFYKTPKKPKENNKNPTNSRGKKETIQMDTFDHAGNAICFSSKPITIVENALPNETCEIEITKTNKHARFAKVTKVVKANEKRTIPFCEFYSQCGGCSIQHTSAIDGLDLKVEALHSFLLKQSGIKEQSWLAPISTFHDASFADNSLPSDHAYRRRVRLAIDARNVNSVKIGYRAASSKDIVNIPRCAIALGSINAVIEALQSSFKSMPGIAKVGHIVITEGSNFTQLALFVSASLPNKAISFLNDFAAQLNIQVCVIGKSDEEQIVGDFDEGLFIQNTRVDVSERASKSDQIGASRLLKMGVHPTHFVQVNSNVNLRMLALARQWIRSYTDTQNAQPVLFDFYCGVGNFSLMLADLFSTVNAYEGVSKMVKTARLNAQLNDVNNCEFSMLDLSVAATLCKLTIPKGAIVVLDPSREGALALSEYLLTTKLAMIIYVSCNPNSFSRDIKVLSSRFEVTKITALDMFPYTKHIELMALLQPK